MRIATVTASLRLVGEAALPGRNFNEATRDRRVLPRLAVPPIFVRRRGSTPADAGEKRRDFCRGAIGLLPIREVSRARKQREIEIGEGFSKPVGPGKRKQRVMLGPADAGRYIDRGELRRLAFDHPDPPLMAGAVMCKTAGEVAGFQEIVGKGRQTRWAVRSRSACRGYGGAARRARPRASRRRRP
jgi:hypothetical protein